jgi:hypothetical protein
LAVGVGYPEAFGRAQVLGCDLSPEAKPESRDVSGAQYRQWRENELSDEQRDACAWPGDPNRQSKASALEPRMEDSLSPLLG